jgi:hypothetical protein
MSELSHVINLTNFWAFSTGVRKAVDNPAHVGALKGRWGGDLDDYTVQTRPKLYYVGQPISILVSVLGLPLFTICSGKNKAVVFCFFRLS